MSNDYTPIWFAGPRGFHDFRAVEAERFNELLDCHLPLEVKHWKCTRQGWSFCLDDVSIMVQQDRFSPLVVVASSETMTRKVLDSLRAAVRKVAILSDGVAWDATALATCLLQVVEEAVSWQQEWHARLGRSPSRNVATQGWNARQQADWITLLGNPAGLDLKTLDDTAAHLLGEPITSISARIAQDLRILHIEPVFRTDLVARHMAARHRIEQDLLSMSKAQLRKSVPHVAIHQGTAEDTHAGLAAYLARPSVTFHGAPRHIMTSIVRYGFVVPGKQLGSSGRAVQVRCGSTYGRGIYSSPDLLFASSYTQYHAGAFELKSPSDVPGMRIVVCATLMGRALQVERATARGAENLLRENVHSHVSPNRLEYIVFNSAQIIPCYVLHLDYGAEHARKEFEKLVADPTGFFKQRRSAKEPRNKWGVQEEQSPGDVQRKKAELKAAARKWFPYGQCLTYLPLLSPFCRLVEY